MDEKLIAKLLQIKGIMETSHHEGEVANAAAMLEKLLTEHNLSIGELERRGSKTAPKVEEHGYDLGKAAFQWKLNLAQVLAGHYFCHGIVFSDKTVAFIGRPDNVEALKMLYGWVIEQIKVISREQRAVWMAERDEHVDPLRWQVNFGLGAVDKIRSMLAEIKRQQAADVETQALVLHHDAEISDYTEQKYGFRTDGKRTAEQQRAKDEQEARIQRWEEEEKKLKEWEERDPEGFYAAHPERHPDAIKAREEKAREEYAAWEKKEEKNAKRRTGRRGARIDYHKMDQADAARYAGRAAAGKINLQPFLGGQGDGRKAGEIR